MESGNTVDQEFMGAVVNADRGVSRLKHGDRIRLHTSLRRLRR